MSTDRPLEIIRPLSTLRGGQRVTIVTRSGDRIPARTCMVYAFDSSGVIAYTLGRKGKAIPRGDIAGWIR